MALIFTILAEQVSSTGPVTSWFDLIMKGGVIMIPIFLLSFLSIYLFIERFAYIHRATVIDNRFVNAVVAQVKDGKPAKAIDFAKKNPAAVGRILESGLSRIGRSAQEVESNLETATNLEITKMEKNTGYLGIIAGIAPMLGFIGTISGVIKIFYSISLADNISIGIISGGLYQKMICSGAGLIVGVVAYAAYHILQMKIDRYTISLQENLLEFLKTL